MKKVLKKALGSYKQEGTTDQYLFYCPFCNHPKRKLSVNCGKNNDSYGYWKCWVCEESGKSPFSLLKKSGNGSYIDSMKRVYNNDSNNWNRNAFNPSSLKDYITKSFEDDTNDNVGSNLSLPDNIREIKPYSPGHTFLTQSRGFSNQDIIRYNIQEVPASSNNTYAGRVIIPSYDEHNNLNYYVARSVSSSSNIKYLNPPCSKNVIIGRNMISPYMPLIITEGVFDMMRVKRNVTCSLGTSISDSLLSYIKRIHQSSVILFYDGDDAGIKGAIKEARKIHTYVETYIVNGHTGDPSNMTTKECWSSIKNNADHFDLKSYISTVGI